MVIAASRLTFLLHGCASLKEKRRILLRMKDRLRQQFPGVAIAEVDSQEIWNQAEMGLSAVSGDARHAQEVLDKAVRYLDDLCLAELIADDSEVFYL